MLYTPLSASGHSDFPIQSLWIGALGALERLSMASFLANGHRYHLYAYDLSIDPPNGVELKDAREILPEDAIFTYSHGRAKGGVSAFADWFRYTLLAKKGGWWCDTDIICLKPFHFENPLVLASERHWLFRKKLSVAVMCAPAAHPLFIACRDEAALKPREGLAFAANGAPILTRHVKVLGLESAVQPPHIFNPVDWWRSASLAAPGSAARLSSESYALHCYGESWRWRLRQDYRHDFQERAFPEDTLIGHLQKRYAMGLVHG